MPTIYQTGQSIDHYEVIRLLGQGGASHVYLARDRRSQQEVVLKFPLDDVIGGRAIFERYRREDEIGKHLTHPALQEHVNRDEERSADYLVLEYLRGQTLRAVMQERAPSLLPQSEVVHILIQLCEGLVYVHAHGVIHRDIKPENIMLLETGEVKLLDFGIALLLEKKRDFLNRGRSSLLGTPDYMAPERWQGEAGSVQSDIYSVGVVLYELLCGRTPFQETEEFTIVNQHISYDPPDILHFNSALPASLATVVMRTIRRDPEKRYASMQELLYDLCHLNKVIPVEYLPDPPLLGGQYRQSLLISLLVLLVCLMIVAFGVLAQFAHHAIH
jgi:eukaryotic-like serine/threonine-protein kinase